MRSIRRLYFFTIALISVEVILWGLISLLRTTFSSGVLFPAAETLAQALALILVGVPIFLLHWAWAQRAASRDAEEHTSSLRALFLYLVLFSTLAPVIQNLLALIDRSLIQVAGLTISRALLGGMQSWVDNLIAIVFNLGAAAYFFNILRGDWATLPGQENFRDIRRLYRYLWMLYGLIMVIFGAQQVIRYLFLPPATTILGAAGNEVFINGVALLLVGTPLWALMWMICQRAESETIETGSLLRLGILYLLSLAGVISVLTSAGVLIDLLLRRVLGQEIPLSELISQAGGPISIGVPLAAIWAYFGRCLTAEIGAVADLPRRAGLKRLYYYILALIGLVASFTGLALLFSFIVEALLGANAILGDVLRNRLAGAISTLLAGLPLWLAAWRPMQAEALESEATGDHARRSLVRRAFLYLAIFATVIGGMASAIWLFYTLLFAVLDHATENFLVDVFNALQLLILFIAFLAYHWAALRRDGSRAAVALTARQAQFAVLVFERQESGFAAQMAAAIQRISPSTPVITHPVEQTIPETAEAARAVVLPFDLALNPPEALRLWLIEYSGHKVIVPETVNDWYWPGGVPHNRINAAAHILQQLAEGQEVRMVAGNSAWQTVAYVFAVLFGLQLLFVLFTLGLSIVFGG
jgi:hypothetical protein